MNAGQIDYVAALLVLGFSALAVIVFALWVIWHTGKQQSEGDDVESS